MQISDTLSPADQFELDDRLDRHNMRQTGINDARSMSIMLRSQDGALYAGLHGFTWGGYCEIRTIWVAESHRRQGIGSKMLRAAMREASSRGCSHVILSTHSFQAQGFYDAHGFERIATLENSPRGHSYILRAKNLIE